MAFYGHRNRWSSYFLAAFSPWPHLYLDHPQGRRRACRQPAIEGDSRPLPGRSSHCWRCRRHHFDRLLARCRPARMRSWRLLLWPFPSGRASRRSHSSGRPPLYSVHCSYAVFFTISCIERVHSLVLALATAIIVRQPLRSESTASRPKVSRSFTFATSVSIRSSATSTHPPSRMATSRSYKACKSNSVFSVRSF